MYRISTQVPPKGPRWVRHRQKPSPRRTPDVDRSSIFWISLISQGPALDFALALPWTCPCRELNDLTRSAASIFELSLESGSAANRMKLLRSERWAKDRPVDSTAAFVNAKNSLFGPQPWP